MSVSRGDSEQRIFAATLYAVARGESELGQRAVVWVIKNRAAKDRSYWGGSSIKGVCLAQSQFECWNGRNSIDVSGEPDAFNKALRIVNNPGNDPTGGCEYYNNPDKEGYPDWTKRVTRGPKIGNHQFYKD